MYTSVAEAYEATTFFFFNDTATTEIYTLSLHDALPIFELVVDTPSVGQTAASKLLEDGATEAAARLASPLHRAGPTYPPTLDRKSTRLNSSHANISYAVFCLKKKKHHHASS